MSENGKIYTAGFSGQKFYTLNFVKLVIKHKQIYSENGEIYTSGKNFILPLAVTAVTNLTSANHYISYRIHILYIVVFLCLIALSHFMFSSSSCLCTTHMIKIFHTVFFISQF